MINEEIKKCWKCIHAQTFKTGNYCEKHSYGMKLAKEIFEQLDHLLPVTNIIEMENYQQLKKMYGVK